MKPLKQQPPPAWKSQFQDGEIIPIKGFNFIIVQITKRGLTFRYAKEPKPINENPPTTD